MKRGSKEHADRVEERIAEMTELSLARSKKALATYGPFASVHEAASVLEEELEEIKREVHRKTGLRSKLSIRNEALDLAAVAIRLAAQADLEQDLRLESDWAES